MKVTVIGGGLAGSEAAWQLAIRGISVDLFEMRPMLNTGAHQTEYLAELVCSNSLGSKLPDRASGVLKDELRTLNSLLLQCAEMSEVPAGGALAVDRNLFSRKVTEAITNHPKIHVIREECDRIPAGPVIIASGPLTSAKLAQAIAEFTSSDHLFFYDAIAPIVLAESVNHDIAFRSSRYAKDVNTDSNSENVGDYINCPMNRDEYYAFVSELVNAERIEIREFEREIELGVKAGYHNYFEGCLPIEILAKRGPDSLAFGPLRPVGLKDPKSGKRPYAVVQLRQDNLAGSLYNLVGFQTNLKFSEQRRIIQMIPGLEKAVIERYGQMHRNTFIYSPKILNQSLQTRNRNDLYIAGQLTGVEGYAGNIGTGLLAGVNCARLVMGKEQIVLPETTLLGALVHYVTHASGKDFQPMKANFGILPRLNIPQKRTSKQQRGKMYAERSKETLVEYLKELGYKNCA